MKICIVTRNMCAGGAERVISQLIKEWCACGCELSLVLLEKRDIFYSLPDNVDIVEIEGGKRKGMAGKFSDYGKVKTAVKKIDPDVVLSMPEEIGIYALWALRHTKIPVVVSERNDPRVMPYKKITRFMRKSMYPHAAGLIFQTERAAEFFPKKIRNKGVVLPNPLDLSRIPEVWTGEREKVIVSAGRLEPQKNFRLLIDAFELFYKTHGDYRLVIYGEGGQREELEKTIAEKSLTKVVELPGVSKTLLHDIRKASMFVLSSDYEGVPNVLIEAMATGVPCVSTDCEPGGAASIIENGVNGILVPVGDKIKLAEAMHNTVETSIGIAAQTSISAAIKSRYDSDYVGRRWLDYLKGIVG